MDKGTRNNIRHATQAGRTLLERAFNEQLAGTYDILLDGAISEQAGSHLNDSQKVTREKLVAAVAHKRSAGLKAKGAVDAYLREAAFTTLNRFVALKMLEARQLVQECISKGEDSSGFKEFTALAPGLVALPDKGYRLYIETLFDEIGQEVKVLFDRRDVASLLWPDRQALVELLGILNATELASVWAEDETIGWVYQYFNGDEDVRAARYDEHGKPKVPQNSRELAVRNQFFTPRYVVQFLTDNTLGRTWYEMMQGETKLAHLDYLVRRTNEVFLADGESAPESGVDDSELSQEELLQQTVHVPFRGKKDPRDLRILDPACGSGHFLLYAFDLLVSIYEEAWIDAGAVAFTETGTQLRDDFGSVEDLRRAMPDLILRHNLHGVDIDPRAAQIAALALWMLAQRAYKEFDVDRAERPPITRTNIVVAEPMPGDAELVEEFAASLKPAVLGDLFKNMVEEMKLAGELGSLLKIEESIAKAVKDAAVANQQGNLLAGKVESQDFWDTADEKIIAALGSFAESAAGSTGVRRQLFVGDAAQGVAFIELMRKRFDAVLMNPPFGLSTELASVKKLYKLAGDNLAAAFVLWARRVLSPKGLAGAVVDATLFSKSSYEGFRKELLRVDAVFGLDFAANLGWGVLDANVEVGALLVGGASQRIEGLDASDCPDERLLEYVRDRLRLLELGKLIEADQELIASLPHHCLPLSPLLRLHLSNLPFSELMGEAKQGLAPLDPFRVSRLRSEIPRNEGSRKKWKVVNRGGRYSPFYRDYASVINWENEGHELKADILRRYPYLNGNPAWVVKNEELYEKKGIGYGKRTDFFSAQVLPEGAIITVEGFGLYPHKHVDVWSVLGFLNSRIVGVVLNSYCGQHKYAGYVDKLPTPSFSKRELDTLASLAREGYAVVRTLERTQPTSPYFQLGPFGKSPPAFLDECAANRAAAEERVSKILDELDNLVAAKLRISVDVAARVYEPEASDVKPGNIIEYALGVKASDWPPGGVPSATARQGDAFNAIPLAAETDSSRAAPPFVADDAGHPIDIQALILDGLTSMWPTNPLLELESEMKRLLGEQESLLVWIRRELFPFHVSSHTRNRRKAPLFWQLATPSASYSIWCYYHRLTCDTFFRVANDYVTPKVDHEERKLNALRQEAGPDPSSTQRKAIDAQETFVVELRAFATEVNRIAPLWNPNLNDGVIINFAPLWRLVPQHKAWQKECKKVWDTLVKGEYDWAHLAMHLWPERVLPKCQDDRSLAIAHGLEEEFWYEDDDNKWQKRLIRGDRVEELVAKRSSTAVKAALKDLLGTPAPAGQTRRKRGGRV